MSLPRSSPGDQSVRYLVIGRVIGPVGVQGAIRAEVLTDFPERFVETRRVYLGDRLIPYDVQDAHLGSGTATLKLAGVVDGAAASALTDEFVYIPTAEAHELAPDEYFWHQLIGLAVYTDDGRFLGRISDILRTGANDVYVVAGERGEILLPAIEDVVRRIDLEAGYVEVALLPGLL